jgi:hypothetical protein
LCHFTLERDDALVIRDTHASELWRQVPTVASLDVRAYIGVPLKSDGQNIGSFCVIDTVPRDWSVDELEAIRHMAVSAARELDLRAALAAARASEADARTQALLKERLMAVAAHDLRTPLQILQLCTTLIQRKGEGDHAAMTARMQSALAMMKTMLDELMRSSAPDTRSRPQDIEAATLAHDAVEMMAPIAQKFSSSLAVDVPPDVILRVDYGQMLRVMGNLIGNSLKYSPPGSSIRIDGKRVGATFELTVTDNGVGMNSEEAEHAFDHGWQGKDGKASGDGAGLGLAIVRSLVALQHGEVTMLSTPGRGTAVTISLPCR